MSTDKPKHGASSEFVSLLTANQRKLYAFILALVRRPADADDVLQETNMVMWRKSEEFELGTGFDAWSFQIARFQVMAYRKRLQRSKLHFDDELTEQLADLAEVEWVGENSRHSALSQCLQKLPADQRKLIAQRYEPGAKVQDLAAKQGRSPKALSEALRRIRRALMECIERRLSQTAATS